MRASTDAGTTKSCEAQRRCAVGEVKGKGVNGNVCRYIVTLPSKEYGKEACAGVCLGIDYLPRLCAPETKGMYVRAF